MFGNITRKGYFLQLLRLFVCNKLVLNYIKQARWN